MSRGAFVRSESPIEERLRRGANVYVFLFVLCAALRPLGAFGQTQDLIFNGEFSGSDCGWTLIPNDANAMSTPGWDGAPGWFFVNAGPAQVPEASQLVTGLEGGQTYTISGYYKRDTENWPGNPFRILIDDVEYFAAGGSVAAGWTMFSFEYAASTTQALLQFRSQVTGDDGYGIDNVAFEPNVSPGTNLIVNGEFAQENCGWTTIVMDRNWSDQAGWDGSPGYFFVNSVAGQVPETSQLITGLSAGQSYTISGYYKRDTENWPGNPFRVLIDNVEYFSAGGSVAAGWTFFSFQYTPADSDALLQFRSQVTGDDAYGIDNVKFVGAAPIPTVSEWGLIVLSLLILTAGTLVYARGSRVHA